MGGELYEGRGEMLVPGSLRGYRCWRLTKGDDVDLFPLHADCSASWARRRRMTASCDNELREPEANAHYAEDSPATNCTCGFYATYDPVSYLAHMPKPWNYFNGKQQVFVHGSIRASGRIILGDWGFRAQYAEVEALWGPHGKAPALNYDVPWFRTRDSFLRQYIRHDVSDLLRERREDD
jgi:hypothetical protein